MLTDRQTAPDDVSHVGAGMAKGAAWMVALRWSRKGLGFGHVLILAWIVGPEDFGLVALAMPVYALFEVLGQFGFDAVLIRNRPIGATTIPPGLCSFCAASSSPACCLHSRRRSPA